MSDVKQFLSKGRPVFPAEHPPQTKARLRAEARLSHPELYTFEIDVPDDIREEHPELAQQIEEQRTRRRNEKA